MRRVLAAFAIVLAYGALPAPAVAQEGETWETQEMVYNVTLIKVFPNMDEQYLNNLKRTWVTGVRESIKEGLTTDYHVYQTVTSNDGGYNLILVTSHPNLASFDATAEWRAKIQRMNAAVEAIISDEETDRITSTVYPEVRKILSEKLVREITFIE